MAMKRRTLIVTEKPFQTANICPIWQDRFPDDNITHFHCPPIGSFRFHLPRDLPIASVPIIVDPVLERRPPRDMMPHGISSFDGDFGALAREAEHIVCATDFDPAGCRNFLDLVEQYRVKTPLSEISWLARNSEDSASILASIDRDLRADHPNFACMAAAGRARQYFDHLYLLNALPVFGVALRAAGIEPTGNQGFLSKYTLQLLLLLVKVEPGPLRMGEIIKMMAERSTPDGRSPMGSPISRDAVVSWLQKNGCLEVHSQGRLERLVLSDRGRRLASLMHKDCYDPHLSTRIEGWGETWPASKTVIDRYVRTFFGKQKRHLLAKVCRAGPQV